MRAKIELDVHHDKRDVEHGCVVVTRDDGKKVSASWTVEGGMGSGFDDVDCDVPGLTEEQADAVADAACNLFSGDPCPSRQDEGEDAISVEWADLVERAKESARIGAWDDNDN